MREREWHQYMTEQAVRHDKRVFTPSELANVAGQSQAVMAVQLHQLVRRGVLTRYAHRLYGLPTGVDALSLLPHLDAAAYITGATALFQHGLVTQVPTRITCFTRRRHFSTTVSTPPGRFELTRVAPRIYAKPEQGLLAGPEQALLDYTYIVRQRGGESPASLVTFRHLDRLDRATLQQLGLRYPKPVQAVVLALR